MKTILAALQRAPKRAAGLMVVAAALIVPASLLAWGPSTRPTYTMEKPADHVVFNSITNNPKHGDERNFVQIREADGKYGEEVQLQPGKEYEVYVFYHNNAKSYLNSAENQYKGIAIDAKMRVRMPGIVKKGEKARFTGIVSASNAQPKEVWDEAWGTNASAADIGLRIMPGSAKITNLGKTNGQTMPNSLFTDEGAPLGFDELNGKVPGCNEFSGYVTFRFKAVQPNFSVTKQVSKAKQNSFSKEIAVNAGETVDYKIEYKNTGTVQQDNVVIKDVLPKGVSYIPGSTHVATSSTGGKWKNITDDGVVANGINIGSYAPGGNAFVAFSAKVTDLSVLECGDNKLVNTVHAITENGSKHDTATVTVKKECETKATYTCDMLAVHKLSDTRFSFETGYKVDGGTFAHVTYIVRDANGKQIATLKGNPNKVEYTQETAGKYSVEAIVSFTVKGKEVTASSDNCKKEFTVPTPPTPPTPDVVEVCRLSDKKIVTIDKSELEKHKDRYSTNLDDCKSTPIEKKEFCTVPGKEHLPKDSPECFETPSELPKTGGLDATAFLGLGAMTISIGYYIASRRSIG